MTLFKRLAAAFLIVVAVAQPTSGQGPAAAVLKSLGTDSRVRFSVEGHRTEGRLGAVQDSVVILRGKRGSAGFRLAAVDSVWRRGRRTGLGAVVGGTAGAALLTGFLHLVAAITCDSDTQCHRDHNRAWALGIVVGGSGGALVGAGVGSLFGRWVRVLP